ncbi:MAG: bifunctional (p)ppGpp synthetase/guanosine-3',5'-bis(diphosphate) 3'-pyrophosphohydrolase [Bacilli bacterium]
MTKLEELTFDKFLDKVKNYIKEDNDIELIIKAYNYAFIMHEGQYRKTGEPYINHPLNTAYILTEIYSDAQTLAASLLHDVLEDCDCTKEDLIKEFGTDITNLVMGVTKLGRINFSTENDYLIEYYKKIIVGMSEDVRVIIIKLADRLHNMRTLYAIPLDKQKSKAKETLEIFAPIASHLGIQKIKAELEDLCLRYLKPDVFFDIVEKLNLTKQDRDKVVNEMLITINSLLTENNIKHELKGRSKSIYSIYTKLDTGRKFSDIYDLLALRVFVNTKEECYQTLGIIHSKFKPIPKRFKDFIAMPKSNLYQSLHTTVFGIDGYLFEIQIRTYEMDEIAENGIAAHWAYKEKTDITNNKNITQQKLQFFKTIMELNEEKLSSEEFVNSVKDEVLNNNIYAFTPKGDVIELNVGSTPIDFAYKVHTKVGEAMTGAIVNNTLVPLNYEIQNNDIVKIVTSKTSTGPSKEWLKIAKNTQTKNKIKSFFIKSEKSIYVEKGKYLLEKEFRKKKIIFSDLIKDENLSLILKELKLDSLEELYLNIGNYKFSPITVINIINKTDNIEEIVLKSKIKSEQDNDIIVAGIDNIKVNISGCCLPIPGDSIIGYITKGNGITVHRSNCHNIINLDERTIDVKWSKVINNKYSTKIVIHIKDASNRLLEIVKKISIFNINVEKINTINKQDNVIYELDLYIKDKELLDKMIVGLEKLNFIEKIERIIQ